VVPDRCPRKSKSRDIGAGTNTNMPNDTIAVLDATSADLSVFQIPAGMKHEEIEAYLAEFGYSLNNCQWQIITSMSIDTEHV